MKTCGTIIYPAISDETEYFADTKAALNEEVTENKKVLRSVAAVHY